MATCLSSFSGEVVAPITSPLHAGMLASNAKILFKDPRGCQRWLIVFHAEPVVGSAGSPIPLRPAVQGEKAASSEMGGTAFGASAPSRSSASWTS